MTEQKKQSPENTINYSNISDFEIAVMACKRDIARYTVERWDELLNTIGQAKGFSDAEKKAEPKKQTHAAVSETTFHILKFETQQGAKIGEYELAIDKNNLPDKFNHAYNILRNSNATIQARYFGEGYLFSYWLYSEGKIYRQKLKTKGTSA